MKKQAITLIALVAALGLLVGAYFLVLGNVDEGDDGAVTAAPDALETLCSLDVESMTALSYLLDGEAMNFTIEQGAWRWDKDASLNLDGAKFYTMVEGLIPLESKVTIEAPTAEQMATFGLDAPRNVITFVDKSGTHTLTIGNYNSYNGCTYATFDRTDVAYMIPAETADAFVYDIHDLLAYDALPAITAGKIDSVTLTRGDAATVYTYYGSGNPNYYTDTFKWFAKQSGGEEIAVSTTAGNSLSSGITALSWSECLSYTASADAAKYGLDAPATLTIAYRATVTTTDPNTGVESSTDVPTTKTILIGHVDPDSGCYYATVEGSSLIYLLGNSALPTLLEPTAALALPTQIAPVNYSLVNKLTLEGGVKRLTVTVGHEGETTYSVGGEPVEYASLANLLNAIQSLVAEANVADVPADAKASTTPTLRISFTFTQGEPREATLTVTPHSTNFDRVSFLGRDDQLISIRDTEKLVELLEDYQ